MKGLSNSFMVKYYSAHIASVKFKVSLDKTDIPITIPYTMTDNEYKTGIKLFLVDVIFNSNTQKQQ